MRRPPRRINHQWLSVRVLAPWQDMAVETFVKISQKCRKKFIMIQVGFARPAPRDPFPSCPVGRMLRAPLPPRARVGGQGDEQPCKRTLYPLMARADGRG